MSSRVSDELALESAEAIERHHGNIEAARKELGIKWHTCRDRSRIASERNLTGFASGGPMWPRLSTPIQSCWPATRSPIST